MKAVYLPFLLQGAFMMVDEFLFHQRRPMPLWERVGHPLDTLTVLITLVLPAFLPPLESNQNVFIGAALFSSVFVTKDEFVHAEVCQKTEHWLHAMLFVLHPITFIAAYFIWQNGEGIWPLQVHCVLVGLFMIYQILIGLRGDIIKKL